MNLLDKIGDFATGLFGREGAQPPTAPVTPPQVGPRRALNDAEAYGVTIEPVVVEPGGWYWQAVRVHHLTPEENGGNHHLYLDVRDPTLGTDANPLGERVFGARVKISWEDKSQTIVIDKPLNEAGANFPMWKWQMCSVQALGLPDQELPSERVTGMHTGHPDEATGNTLFHHSFSVTFCKVQAPDVAYADSVIYGVIRNAAGRTARLMQGDETVASQTIAADETFHFVDLPAGEYTVAVEGTQLRSEPQKLNGQNQAQLALTLVLAESVISGRVRNGAGRTLLLIRDEAEVTRQTVADDETYQFTNLPAGTYRVGIEGTPVASRALTLDGSNPATAALAAPAEGKPLAHYVLFGPAEQPATRANLLLAQDFLLTFRLTFGFSPAEAAGAGLVTIIADTTAVSQQVEGEFTAAGVPVQRIAGSVEEVAAALAARIEAGQPFV